MKVAIVPEYARLPGSSEYDLRVTVTIFNDQDVAVVSALAVSGATRSPNDLTRLTITAASEAMRKLRRIVEQADGAVTDLIGSAWRQL